MGTMNNVDTQVDDLQRTLARVFGDGCGTLIFGHWWTNHIVAVRLPFTVPDIRRYEGDVCVDQNAMPVEPSSLDQITTQDSEPVTIVRVRGLRPNGWRVKGVALWRVVRGTGWWTTAQSRYVRAIERLLQPDRWTLICWPSSVVNGMPCLAAERAGQIVALVMALQYLGATWHRPELRAV